MVQAMKALGAVEPENPQKVSSGRVVMFAAFAFFAAIAIYVAAMIGLGRPEAVETAEGFVTTWDQWQGFVGEVGATIKWFLGPYVVGSGVSAYKVAKKNGHE